MSLRARLILTHTLIALCAIILVAVIVNRVVSQRFDQLALAQARALAEALAEPLAECHERHQGWPRDLRRCLVEDELGRTLLPLRRPNSQRILVADPQQRLLFDSKQSLPAGQPLPAALRRGAVAITSGGRQVGSVAVVPAAGTYGREEDAFLGAVRRSVLLTSLLAGLLALLIGTLLAQGLTRRLRALTRAAHGLAAGSGTGPAPAELPPPHDDEVGELTRAFGAMSLELGRQEELRRQMVADIAHELRTPLSVLRLELESIEDGVTAPTPAVIGSLNEEVGLLNRLIDDLRLLSVTEAGQLQLSPEPLAAAAEARRALERLESTARAQSIDLSAAVAADLPPVQADPTRLQQILGNLLHNALRYTPPGGRVALEVRRDGPEIVFSVSDTGPGFSAEEALVIFERFYRADKARARDTGGSGLGLAIVRGLAIAMGGRVWATSLPGVGAAFHVALPVA